MEHLKAPPPLTLTRKVISYWAEECLKDLQETMAVEGIWHADFSVLVFCTKEQLLTLREERGELHSFSQMFLFFYSLKFCVWLCWLLLFVSLLSGTLSCLLQCWPWDSLCHDFSRTKVLRPSFLIAPEVTFHAPLPLFPGPLIWSTFCLLPCPHRLRIALGCLSFNIQSKPLFLSGDPFDQHSWKMPHLSLNWGGSHMALIIVDFVL